MSAVERLFAPCDRYEFDAELGIEETVPSCVDCFWQYAPGKVCPEFQRRLLGLAACEGYQPESEV